MLGTDQALRQQDGDLKIAVERHVAAGADDLVAMALACRFKHARTVSRIEEAADVRALLHEGDGPILVNAKISAEDVPRVLPLRDGHAIKQRFIETLNAV